MLHCDNSAKMHFVMILGDINLTNLEQQLTIDNTFTVGDINQFQLNKIRKILEDKTGETTKREENRLRQQKHRKKKKENSEVKETHDKVIVFKKSPVNERAPNTISTYEAFAKKVIKQFEIPDIDPFENYIQAITNQSKEVIEWLNNEITSINSRRTYYGLIPTLNNQYELGIQDDIIRSYIQELDLIKDFEDTRPNYVPKMNLLRKSVTSIKPSNSEYASKKHIITALYTLIPPRRRQDYHNLKIYDKIKPESDSQKNYIIVIRGGFIIHIESYKTAWKYGTYEKTYKIKGGHPLQKLLREWIKKNNDNNHIYNYNLDYMTEFVKASFKLICDQENITPNTCRHSKADEFWDTKPLPTINVIKEINRDMSHSLETSLKYRSVVT